ncbi:putative serine/threonine protein kinase [Blattamonas nauphoetae]|uniref:non-specific serine/threonine protein kinase n=1 Tax=Blattamonas nauphoetae TaxID=2049346 RepID=A0ABQ9XTF3_9EUKA|nr:putative serine/threonine protein kinase [Blattamonas nauphoetae]
MSQKSINDYTRLRQLGQGTFGKTYLAFDTKTTKLVVLKKIKMDGTIAEDYVRNEIASMVQLKGENLVQFLGNFGDSHVHWIVQEFCEGGSLRDYLDDVVQKGGRVSEDDLWNISVGLLRGVSTMHSQSILHRDIKPDNILLTRDGTLKLGDMGSSKLITQSLTASQTQTGTYPYLSPEQLSSQPTTTASDVWACGIVLAELSLGTLPFNASSLPAYLVAVLQGEPAPLNPAQFSPAWRDLVSRLLMKDPAQRISASDALLMAQAQCQVGGKDHGLRDYCEEHARKEQALLSNMASDIETKKTKLQAKMSQLEGITKYGEEQKKAKEQKENEAKKLILENDIAILAADLTNKEREEAIRAEAAQQVIRAIRTNLGQKRDELAQIVLSLSGSRFETHSLILSGKGKHKEPLWVQIPNSVKVSGGEHGQLTRIQKTSADGYINLLVGSEMKTGKYQLSFMLEKCKGNVHVGVVSSDGLNQLGTAVGMGKNEWGFLLTHPDGLHASSSVNLGNVTAHQGSTVRLEFDTTTELLTLFINNVQQRSCYGGLKGSFHFMISMYFKDDSISSLEFTSNFSPKTKSISGQKIVRFD